MREWRENAVTLLAHLTKFNKTTNWLWICSTLFLLFNEMKIDCMPFFVLSLSLLLFRVLMCGWQNMCLLLRTYCKSENLWTHPNTVQPHSFFAFRILGFCLYYSAFCSMGFFLVLFVSLFFFVILYWFSVNTTQNPHILGTQREREKKNLLIPKAIIMEMHKIPSIYRIAWATETLLLFNYVCAFN